MTQEKKVTVEVTKDYRDIEKSLVFHVGETHDVTKKRAEALVKAGVVKIPDLEQEVAPVQPEQREEEGLGMIEPEEAEKKPSKTSRKVKTES